MPFGVTAAVSVIAGVFDAGNVGLFVLVGTGVNVAITVDVDMTGVDDALVTPMMTGVWVYTNGVGVKGRNGVGGLLGNGWMTQPLQDASVSIKRIVGISFFISSPHFHCTLL
jgi:hypothetical protein